MIIAECVCDPRALISTVENRFLNLDLIWFVFRSALRQDLGEVGLVDTPHALFVIFFCALFILNNSVSELRMWCHGMQLACSAHSVELSTKLSICLNANPSEIVLFQS